MKNSLALLLVSVTACAQAPLTTPVSILPKADHSAAGIVQYYDKNKVKSLNMQYDIITLPDLDQALTIKDFPGTTSGHSLSMETDSLIEYFYVIGGTDAAAPGRVGAPGGMDVVTTNNTFPAITVIQTFGNQGIESDVSMAGLSAFIGNSAATVTAPTMILTNSHSGGIAATLSGTVALNANGEVRPAAAATYTLGDNILPWLNVFSFQSSSQDVGISDGSYAPKYHLLYGGDLVVENATGVTVATISNSGLIQAFNGFENNGVPGVSCSGTPTSLFRSVLGIVTHCAVEDRKGDSF